MSGDGQLGKDVTKCVSILCAQSLIVGGVGCVQPQNQAFLPPPHAHAPYIIITRGSIFGGEGLDD